ncbi:leucine rich adaptor protein 1 [Coturnix japonica]|uniref:Leucine rich adaptor protein 1 n=1 Tax=Coturnix japonica TaxID=93934 RepID=A0A8C2YA73_COTJA|nr:leucine rich adaptor protein 1 [Coturnix japonica]
MEGGGDALPADLRELLGKVGRRPPAGLLRGLRSEPAPSPPSPLPAPVRGARPPLADRLRALRLELAYLRAVDVKILQQLVAVNEGIEAVKWLLEEKSTLTSRCSSLASSQYSLAGSQTASRRGSWDSLQDPPDKLDSISIGSYLDTLADDMDEYSQNAAELPRALGRAEQDWGRLDPERGFTKQEKGRAEQEWPHTDLSLDRSCPDPQRFAKEPQVANGYSGKEPKLGPGERLEKGNVGGKARKAEANLENCKLNSELHLEYDAHWLWLQSQDDVTFL